VTGPYLGLYFGYAAAVSGWLAARALLPGLWPRRDPVSFRRPWLEVLWILLVFGGVLLIGQLYVRGVRLPSAGPLGPLAEALNQALIFLPLPLLLLFRRQGPATAWITTSRVPVRLLVGLVVAGLALTAYLAARGRLADWGSAVVQVYHPKRIGIAVQVFFEDLAVAMAMVRLSAALKSRTAATAFVAILFAAGHIPALLAGGTAPGAMVSLVWDLGLALAALSAAQRSADIWWLWCVHFTMDMTQFLALGPNP